MPATSEPNVNNLILFSTEDFVALSNAARVCGNLAYRNPQVKQEWHALADRVFNVLV